MKKTLKSVDLNLISEFILSILVLIMGVVVMIFKTFGLIDVVLYGSVLFYIYAIFSTICYFVGRKEGDYELLLLALINIITATFMFIFKKDNPAMILGAGMTIFTIMMVANRGVKVITLRREDNYMWVIKFIITFLIGFLGMLTTFNLFGNVTVQTMMFGFYFISLGFMLVIESLINIFITNDKFKKILSKILEDETSKKLEPIKEKSKHEEKIKKEVKIETKVTPKKETKIDTKPVVKKEKEIELKPTIIKQEKPKVKSTTTKTKIEKKNEPKVDTKKVVVTPKKAGRPKKVEVVEKKKDETLKVKKEKETKSSSATTKKIKIEKKSEPKVDTKKVVATPKKSSSPKKEDMKINKTKKSTKVETKKTSNPKKVKNIEATTKRKPGRPKKIEK